nr:DNA repair protein RecN [Microbacterium halimionae]
MRLRDLGVIADATLPIGRGFTAITGETGAGKTMVVSGLGLLLGNRADSSAVRAGASQASVDGAWLVPDSGAVADRVHDAGGDVDSLGDGTAELLMARTLSREGRSRASVGGRVVPVGVLSEIADQLVVVHGQSDQLRLRSASAQRDALDRFAGAPVAEALAVYRDSFERHREINDELDALVTYRGSRSEEAALLRAQISAIEHVNPQPGEDAALAERAQRLANAEELRLSAATAHAMLASEDGAPDIVTILAEVRRTLERADDPVLAEAGTAAADLGYRATDLAATLSGYLADLDDAAPAELAALEERRAVLGELVRTHGSIDAAIGLLAIGSARLIELDDDDDRVTRLEAERHEASVALDDAADTLSASRRDAASRLAEAVTEELHALALPDARVVVEVSESAPTATGRDEVALLLAPHPGAEPRPVARSASGGELSRVMLAIEVVIAGTDPVPTFVFDEVDAGIGGAAAIEVGRRLAKLAESAQVIAVTHLAQVAAFAGNHLGVVKASDGTVTESSVRRLDGAAREAEMARLLSGLDDSEAALSHARELLALGAGSSSSASRSR